MDPLATRSQPEPGVLRNPAPPQQQPQIRQQVPKPPQQQQPLPPQAQNINYQQQQGYRLPSPGQQPSNLPPQNQQPVIRPPLVPNVRPLINPQQQPLIRNLPPQQQGQALPQVRPPVNPQFRPPQAQQGFPPRQSFVPQTAPEHQQQQFRPQVPLQRPPEPQKIIRPSLPLQQPQQQQSGNNMMAEMNREKTFTTNNNNNEQSIDDDDDDVVVGRMTTPQSRNGQQQKPVESFGKENVQQQPQQRPVVVPPPIDNRRRESVQSIPSRPPSGLGSNQSASPEPRSPGIQQQFNNNNNRPEQINRQGGDYVRDTSDYDRVQRPMPPPQQRQSPEEMNRVKIPQQPVQLPIQKPPVTTTHQQPTIQDHLPFMKPNLISSEPPQQPTVTQPPPQQEMRKPQAMQNVRKTVELDLGKPVDSLSSKNHHSKGDNDSGVDESTQEKEKNGNSPNSPLKSPSKIPSYQPRPASITPKSRSRSTSKQRLSLLKASPDEPIEPLIKKVPMNKIEVGNAPSPNLRKVASKIGSLENATYKPGGGHVKIESKKVEIKATPRIEAKNDAYVPRGGDKKIISHKLQWNARSKIGSLENATHKPGGGDKKIVEIKTDFKEKAKPKVGSKDNMTYVPGGGDVKIISQKIDVKADSKIGSLDNVKHKPGGGDKKIFDDKEYLKNVDHPIPISPPSQCVETLLKKLLQNSPKNSNNRQSPLPSGESTGNLAANNNLVDLQEF